VGDTVFHTYFVIVREKAGFCGKRAAICGKFPAPSQADAAKIPLAVVVNG
jgi:hypothetical protein